MVALDMKLLWKKGSIYIVPGLTMNYSTLRLQTFTTTLFGWKIFGGSKREWPTSSGIYTIVQSCLAFFSSGSLLKVFKVTVPKWLLPSSIDATKDHHGEKNVPPCLFFSTCRQCWKHRCVRAKAVISCPFLKSISSTGNLRKKSMLKLSALQGWRTSFLLLL